MAHSVLSHTADTGVEATADTLPELISELLEGMFGLMAPIEEVAPRRWVEATVESETAPDLVVDALSEALYWSEVEDLMPTAFEVSIDTGKARLRLGGVAMGAVEATGPAIKAVTYHGLVTEERQEGWYGRVYFDV